MVETSTDLKLMIDFLYDCTWYVVSHHPPQIRSMFTQYTRAQNSQFVASMPWGGGHSLNGQHRVE